MTLSVSNLLAFAPELWLVAGALIGLGLALVWPSPSGRGPTIVAQAALLGSLAALVTQLRTPLNILNGAFVLDGYAALLDVVMLTTAGVVLLLNLTREGQPGAGADRAPAFVLLASCGGMLLVSAADLLSFFAAQELLAVSVAIAIGLRTTRRERIIGPLIAGLAGSAAVAYGLAVAYGSTGETGFVGIGRALAARGANDLPALLILVLVVGGATFRLTAPVFRWLSDLGTGGWEVRAMAAALLSVAGFGSLQRLVVLWLAASTIPWQPLLAGLAALVMTGGTLGALAESRVSRALALAAMGQAGFILAGLAAVGQPSGVAGVAVLLVGTPPVLLAVTIPTGRFADVTGARGLADFSGMIRRAPLPALVLALGTGSLAGLPPLIGFFGRVLVLAGAVESGLTWLALVGLVNLLLMGGWAVRTLRVLALEPPWTEEPEPAPDWPARVAYSAASAGVAMLGLLLSPIVNAAASVTQRLPR